MDNHTEMFLSLYLDVHDALERALPDLQAVIEEYKSTGPAPSKEGAGSSDGKEVLQ